MNIDKTTKVSEETKKNLEQLAKESKEAASKLHLERINIAYKLQKDIDFYDFRTNILKTEDKEYHVNFDIKHINRIYIEHNIDIYKFVETIDEMSPVESQYITSIIFSELCDDIDIAISDEINHLLISNKLTSLLYAIILKYRFIPFNDSDHVEQLDIKKNFLGKLILKFTPKQ